MGKAKKKLTSSQKKAIANIVAEVIWISIGAIFLLGGLASLVLSAFIANLDGNYKAHPFYPIYQFQSSFFEWLEKWSKIKMSSFLVLGLILVVVSSIYLLIVLYIYANKKDAKDKKDRAKKLREKNLKKFEQERLAIKEKQEAKTVAQETAPVKEEVQESTPVKEETTEETTPVETKETVDTPVEEEKVSE